MTSEGRMKEFESQGESFKIRGLGWGISVKNPGGYPEPNVLSGEEVLLDGQQIRIKAVETFAINRPYPDSLDFGFLLDQPHRKRYDSA